MKIKINTGLIATNGDGKPSFRPPIPAGWCRPLAAPNSEEAQSVKIGVSNIYKSDPKMSENLSAVENQAEDESAIPALTTPHQTAANGTADVQNSQMEQDAAAALVAEGGDEDSQQAREMAAPQPSLHEEQNDALVGINTSSPSPSLAPAVSLACSAPSFEAASPLETSAKAESLAVSSVPSIAENEDSNVDVETEEQLAPLEGSTSAAASDSLGFTTMPENADLLRREEAQLEHSAHSQNNVNCLSSNTEFENMHSHKQDEDSALAESDAQYIEKQVVNSFLHQERPSDYAETADVHVLENSEDAQNGGVIQPPSTSTSSPLAMSVTPLTDSGIGDTTPGSSGGRDSVGKTQQPEKVMDALSMTIASVAAGEGEPPEYKSKFVPEPTKSKPISPLRQGQTNTSNKHKKSRADRPMSASARLPVISSLLAPTSVAPHQSNVLPGIQHIAPSGRASNSPNTVLPSVAHFLGPAKSPPSGYNQQQHQQPQHSTPDLLPSMGHQAGDLNQYQNTPGGHGPNSGVTGTPSSSGRSNKGNRKPVTPAGLRLSMAASEELPDPLPVPQYSDKVLRAKQLGTVAFDRPTVLRETVQFFLQYKHYWSSHDYDRISNLVIELFPEFKDNSDTPGVPANKRIRTDLSMYARNFRRREVSQRKKDGGPSLGPSTTPIDPNKPDQSISPTIAGPSSSDNKSFLHTQSSPSQQQPQLTGGAVAAGNPANSTDFCNELLTAASIIESQNTSAGTRNGEMAGQMSQNHHKAKVSEREVTTLETSVHKPAGLQEPSSLATGSVEGCVGNNGYHAQQQRVMVTHEDSDSQPIHFVYDKDTVPAAASRDASAAWQMYSDQMAQAMATSNPNMEYGMTEQAIKKDLGTCARNMRRRLPAAKYKPGSSQAQKTSWNASSSGVANNSTTGMGGGMEATQGLDASGSAVQTNPTEYMKALMAAQGMNLSELGMSQRNLGELAVLAGIKQRIEQHPSEVSDLERQYLAQCSTEERQALLSSGVLGSDSTAMAALSAFYGQLGVDISSGTKRGQDYPPTSVSAAGVSAGLPDGNLGELLVVPNKRQRRISQAEVEKRLREAELNHVTQQGQHLHHFQQLQQQQQHLDNVPKSSHQGTLGVSISEKHLVKREPSSPTGVEGLKNRQQHNHHHLQNQHHNQHHQHQQLTVPSPVNMSNFSVSTANGMGLAPMSSSSSASSAHDQAYWDSQTASNMALMGLATSVAPLMATQAHSQAQVQHLSGHPHPGISSSHGGSHEVPMNLTYHEADKTESPSSQSSHTHHRHLDESPSVQEPLPDTAGLAAQVEVTTSAVKSPRRRASSSPRSGSQQGDSSLSQREQVWFPHGQGFKKENQEVVCLPDPLPVPVYSQKIAAARDEGTSMRHRSEIIRETARFFLGLKYWWSSADYTRISELVVQHFPDLKDDSTGDGMNNYRRIQRDLSMCARNLRRSKKPRKMRELSSSDLANSMMLDGEDSDQHHQGPVVENKKRPTRPKGTLYGAAAERKAKRQAGTSAARSKRAKLHLAAGQASSLDTTGASAVAASVVGAESAGVGVTEDMTAAAALMQQQFMQQSPATSVSSGYISQHPSAHLLPTAHLMPSLHTHPALHGQHIQQMNASLLQQEGTSITVEEAHSAKRLVKEEPGGPDSMDHTHSGIKANMVAPMQRALSPTLGLDTDGQASAAAELAKQRVLRDMEAGVISREDADKLSQAQVQPGSTLKVYMDPDHGSDLQERFSTLWRKGKFFDASLGVANKKLHVHKLVLLAMSPYLQETFKNADPRSQLEVNLPSDTTYETAKAFLKYIYEGVLEVDTSSVRSLHKIATMLQMNKLAQYCQNFAQQLQEEAEQALQRLGETQMTSDLHRATRYATEEHLHFKAGYLSEAQQAEAAATQPHFLHQDALAQHRALVAASSPTSSHQHQQHHHHHQQQNTGSSSELLLSSGGPASAQDLATQHLIQAALVRHQAGSPSSTTVAASSSLYQQEALSAVGGGVPVSDNSALLQRLTSPALAAYWQAHTLTELMSRGGVTSDPSNQTSASELAAIAAAAAAATTSSSSLPLSSSSEDQRLLGKGGGRGSGLHPSQHQHHHQQAHHHQQQQHKDTQQWAQHAEAAHHHGSMLPETCLPGELSRGNS